MRLDEAIVKHLDAKERTALAAELGVDWAELPGQTVGARAAALVTVLGEAGRASDLLAALAQRRPRVRWAELPYPRDTLNHLHAELTRRHNLDGLRSLCFHLGLDYDDLAGEGKSGRARELVLAMDRLGRAAELFSKYEIRDTRYELRGVKFSTTIATQIGWYHSYFASRISYLVSRISLNSSLATRHSSLLLVAFLLLLLAWLVAAGDPSPSAALTKAVGPRATASSPAANTVQAASAKPGSGSMPDPTDAVTTPVAAPTGEGEAAVSLQPAPTAGGLPAVMVGERGANLRRGPGPQYEIVATLRAGVALPAHGINPSGEWIQVRLPGKGWPWIDVRYAVLPTGVELPVIAQVVSVTTLTASSTNAPEPPTPSPVATTSPTRPPYYGPPPTPLPTRTPHPTAPPYYWLTPTSPPP